MPGRRRRGASKTQVVRATKKEVKREVKKELPRVFAGRTLPNRPYAQGKLSKRGRVVRKLFPVQSVAKQLSSGMTRGIGATLRSEPSAANWPLVYKDPFLKIDARLPIWPVRATLCQIRYSTIFGKCNENGNGWISFVPANMICNDIGFAFASNGPDASDQIATGGTDVLPVQAEGQYSLASFTQGFSMRIVAWGFRIRYIGTNDNGGGFITFHQMMPRQEMTGQTSTTIQSSFVNWKQYKFNNNFKQMNRIYTEMDDGLYMNSRDTVDPGLNWFYDDFADSNSECYNYIGAYINGAAPNVPFEVQVSGHYELIGPLNNMSGVKTATLNTKLHERTINEVAQARSKDNGTPDWGKYVGGIEAAGIIAGLF